MDYPVNCITAKDKTEYLYIAQEALRELHNKFVEWHEDGLLQADYDMFPADIKKKYGFVNSIDMATLQRFLNEDFMTRSALLCNEITVHRAALSKSDREEIMGVPEERDKDGNVTKEGTTGTKAQLIKSKRWTVNAASDLPKKVSVVIG